MDMTGFCRKCGRAMFVDAADQNDADIRATQKCDCEQIAKTKQGLRYNLHQICGESAEDYGLDPMKAENITLLEVICDRVAEKKVEQAKLLIDGTDIVIKNTSKGCSIQRTKKRNVKLEA